MIEDKYVVLGFLLPPRILPYNSSQVGAARISVANRTEIDILAWRWPCYLPWLLVSAARDLSFLRYATMMLTSDEGTSFVITKKVRPFPVLASTHSRRPRIASDSTTEAYLYVLKHPRV